MDFVLLGRRIRDERLLLRLTLEKLAERTDKSINFIGQIERGEAKPSVETLVDIANALGISIDSLLTDSVKVSNDSYAKEISALLQAMDNTGKQYTVDIMKKYVFYHGKKN